MANLHSSGPDTLAELESWSYDLLPACIVSTTWPTAPGSGLTISAFSTQGYVRKGTLLYYVDQPARAITLPASDGTYYLALTTDTHSTVGSFTRVAGSHYAYLQSATLPTFPDGTTPIASAVVSGGNVTSVDTAMALTPPLSRQTADAVAITGGAVLGVTTLQASNCQFDGNTLVVDPTTHRVGVGIFTPGYQFDVNDMARVRGRLYLGSPTLGWGATQELRFPKDTLYGLVLNPTGNDAGGFAHVLLTNVAGTVVGSIYGSATTTTYNTSSDVRLKRNIAPLTGALAVIAALNPVSHRWNADDSYGEGFLAHELQQVLPHAVTGEPDAVNDDGSVRPQQVDHSKLVPWLTAALKETLAQVEALTARVASLEEALGL